MGSQRLAVWMAAWSLMTGLLTGCTGMRHLDAEHAGRTLVYEPGLPNFDLEAVSTLQDGTPGVEVYLGIPHASLVFVPRDSLYVAQFETLVRLYDERGKELEIEQAAFDTVRVGTYEATQSYLAHTLHRRLEPPPSTYVVEVTLRNGKSGQEAVRRQRLEVVDPGTTRPLLSSLRLEVRRGGHAFEPLVALSVPAGMDSLRAVVALYNADRLGTTSVTMRLLHIPTDTTVARPPYLFTGLPFTNLIRYDAPDTVQVTRRRLTDPNDELDLYIHFPALDPGLYRAEMEVAPADADDDAGRLYAKRDVIVRRATFPRITSLDGMVDALVYIAREKEIETIRAADTEAERKRRFDAFWGSLLPNRQVAANLLKLYYSRVEEANLLYTNYKEGWKTDRGMVHVVLGTPLYIEDLIDRQIWRYSYDTTDPLHTFTFERRRIYASEGVFDAFILDRDGFHEPGWRRAIDRWRRGDVQ